MDKETQEALQSVMAQLSALDSRMRVIAQRMKVIEKNEQIIGKTLITHNKKLKEADSAQAAPSVSVDLTEIRAIADDVKKSKIEISELMKGLKDEVVYNRECIDKISGEVGEMKYVLDTINPVEYVTISQVSDLVDEKLRRIKKS